jgi:hypothetical protein
LVINRVINQNILSNITTRAEALNYIYLLEFCIPALHKNPGLILQKRTFFQQDGGAPHFTCSVKALINKARIYNK